MRSETRSTSTPSSGADALDDPLEVVGVGGVDGDVAHLRRALDADEVDRAERATCVADRLREPRERARGVGECARESWR